MLKDKEVVINKDILKAVDYKRKRRKKIHITFIDQFIFSICQISYFESKVKELNKAKIELLIQADYEIDKKTNFINMIKIQDELNLLSKVILNENQCFMLKNINKKVLVNKEISKNQLKYLQTEKLDSKEQELIKYLKEKNIENSSDKLLFSHIDD